MSELPESWSSVPLLEVSKLVRGVTYTKADARSESFAGSIPVLRANNIQDRGFRLEDLVHVPTVLVSEQQRVTVGDVVVATSSGSISVVGKAAQALEDMNVGFGAFCGLLRPETCIHAPYFGFFFSSDDYRNAVSSMARGVNINNLKREHFESLELPLAPLAEQKRIADKLEAVLGRVDACRARLDRVPDLLKRFRQSVLAAATSGQLTEDWREKHPRQRNADSLAALIRKSHADAGGHKAGNAAPPSEDIHDLTTEMFPNGWQVLPLREAVSPDRPITYGILMPGPELKEGVPYVRVADFPNDRLNLTTIRNTSLAMDEQFKRSRLRTGDLLMSIRGTVGRMVVVPPELEAANITQDTARLSIQPEISSTFVLWYLRSPMAQSRMRAATKGVAVRGMNIGDIRALQLPLPSFDEQQEIVRRVEALFALADRIEARLTATRAQVERLTPATLSKAFRGDLVPQDPNDEPANALLERLRISQSETPTTKKPRQQGNGKRPRAPKETAAMTKSRFDEDVKGKPYLAGFIGGPGYALTAEQLFHDAQLSLVDFYKQLSWEVEQGMIKENGEDLEVGP